jgi:adenylosuccinate synthase
MFVDVVLGLQRGDEGKGRVVDLMAKDYQAVARFNGGANAGHTVVLNDTVLRLHQVPSGIIYPKKINIIGNGCLVDPKRLIEEISEIRKANLPVSPENLLISNGAHLVMPHHISLDEIRENSKKNQGSTKRGISYVAADKYKREGLRTELIGLDIDRIAECAFEELEKTNHLRSEAGLRQLSSEKITKEWMKYVRQLKPYITDTVEVIHDLLESEHKVLAEGAQAIGLDIDHGMYPYVTSSHTTVGGVLSGLGVGASSIDDVIGVAKALRSHVGGGPFVTKITDEQTAKRMRGEKGKIDSEYGASTGRERQVGYFDLVELRRARKVGGIKKIVLTKVDTLNKFGESMPIATHYRINGKLRDSAPGNSAAMLEKCEPVYEEIPLWKEDISKMKRYEELPANAKRFISLVSEKVGVPVTMIGVGPERSQIIHIPINK